MSKQDRQGVRTPADVERKYNLGQLAAARGESQKQELALSQLTQTVNQYMASNNGNIENLNKDISNLNDDIDKMNEDVNDSLEEMNGTIDDLNKDIEELNKKIEELPDNPGGGGGGVSPTVDVTEIEGGHRVTITDAEGTEPFDVMDGKDGKDAEVTKNNVISALGYTPADASLYVEDTTYPGCYYRMAGGEKEWLNPPMAYGVEYRTTKRKNGEAIYTKKVNAGAMPNKGYKAVTIGAKASKIDWIIVVINDGTYTNILPFVNGSGTVGARFFTQETGTCSIHTFEDMSNRNAEITLEYTK